MGRLKSHGTSPDSELKGEGMGQERASYVNLPYEQTGTKCAAASPCLITEGHLF